MATSTRTYKNTDWNIWVYTPVPGKFRLDFSLLNGSDVLSATDEGGLEIANLEIISINISESTSLRQGTLQSIEPGQAIISARIENFQKNDLIEYYSGKQIAITLKNEITDPALALAVYGYNTPYFFGKINDVSMTMEPFSNYAIVEITAQENLVSILNTPMILAKYNFPLAIEILSTDLANYNLNNEYGEILFRTEVGQTYYGTLEDVEGSVGEFLQEYLEMDVLGAYFLWRWDGTNWKRLLYFNYFPSRNYLISTPAFGLSRQIAEKNIYRLGFGIDGLDKPTSMIIRQSDGNGVYTFSASAASTLSPLTVLDVTLDIKDFTSASLINNMRTNYDTELNVIEVSVLNAYENQDITFDNKDDSANAGRILRPITNADSGWRLTLDLSNYGYSATENFYVMGKNHEITQDSWVTTYRLMKGL
jgi:hypothetical protein